MDVNRQATALSFNKFIGFNGNVPVENPFTGQVCGEVNILLAAGTNKQMRSFNNLVRSAVEAQRMTRGFLSRKRFGRLRQERQERSIGDRRRNTSSPFGRQNNQRTFDFGVGERKADHSGPFFGGESQQRLRTGPFSPKSRAYGQNVSGYGDNGSNLAIVTVRVDAADIHAPKEEAYYDDDGALDETRGERAVYQQVRDRQYYVEVQFYGSPEPVVSQPVTCPPQLIPSPQRRNYSSSFSRPLVHLDLRFETTFVVAVDDRFRSNASRHPVRIDLFAKDDERDVAGRHVGTAFADVSSLLSTPFDNERNGSGGVLRDSEGGFIGGSYLLYPPAYADKEALRTAWKRRTEYDSLKATMTVRVGMQQPRGGVSMPVQSLTAQSSRFGRHGFEEVLSPSSKRKRDEAAAAGFTNGFGGRQGMHVEEEAPSPKMIKTPHEIRSLYDHPNVEGNRRHQPAAAAAGTRGLEHVRVERHGNFVSQFSNPTSPFGRSRQKSKADRFRARSVSPIDTRRRKRQSVDYTGSRHRDDFDLDLSWTGPTRFRSNTAFEGSSNPFKQTFSHRRQHHRHRPVRAQKSRFRSSSQPSSPSGFGRNSDIPSLLRPYSSERVLPWSPSRRSKSAGQRESIFGSRHDRRKRTTNVHFKSSSASPFRNEYNNSAGHHRFDFGSRNNEPSSPFGRHGEENPFRSGFGGRSPRAPRSPKRTRNDKTRSLFGSSRNSVFGGDDWKESSAFGAKKKSSSSNFNFTKPWWEKDEDRRSVPRGRSRSPRWNLKPSSRSRSRKQSDKREKRSRSFSPCSTISSSSSSTSPSTSSSSSSSPKSSRRHHSKGRRDVRSRSRSRSRRRSRSQRDSSDKKRRNKRSKSAHQSSSRKRSSSGRSRKKSLVSAEEKRWEETNFNPSFANFGFNSTNNAFSGGGGFFTGSNNVPVAATSGPKWFTPSFKVPSFGTGQHPQSPRRKTLFDFHFSPTSPKKKHQTLFPSHTPNLFGAAQQGSAGSSKTPLSTFHSFGIQKQQKRNRSLYPFDSSGHGLSEAETFAIEFALPRGKDVKVKAPNTYLTCRLITTVENKNRATAQQHHAPLTIPGPVVTSTLSFDLPNPQWSFSDRVLTLPLRVSDVRELHGDPSLSPEYCRNYILQRTSLYIEMWTGAAHQERSLGYASLSLPARRGPQDMLIASTAVELLPLGTNFSVVEGWYSFASGPETSHHIGSVFASVALRSNLGPSASAGNVSTFGTVQRGFATSPTVYHHVEDAVANPLGDDAVFTHGDGGASFAASPLTRGEQEDAWMYEQTFQYRHPRNGGFSSSPQMHPTYRPQNNGHMRQNAPDMERLMHPSSTSPRGKRSAPSNNLNGYRTRGVETGGSLDDYWKGTGPRDYRDKAKPYSPRRQRERARSKSPRPGYRRRTVNPLGDSEESSSSYAAPLSPRSYRKNRSKRNGSRATTRGDTRASSPGRVVVDQGTGEIHIQLSPDVMRGFSPMKRLVGQEEEVEPTISMQHMYDTDSQSSEPSRRFSPRPPSRHGRRDINTSIDVLAGEDLRSFSHRKAPNAQSNSNSRRNRLLSFDSSTSIPSQYQDNKSLGLEPSGNQTFVAPNTFLEVPRSGKRRSRQPRSPRRSRPSSAVDDPVSRSFTGASLDISSSYGKGKTTVAPQSPRQLNRDLSYVEEEEEGDEDDNIIDLGLASSSPIARRGVTSPRGGRPSSGNGYRKERADDRPSSPVERLQQCSPRGKQGSSSRHRSPASKSRTPVRPHFTSAPRDGMGSPIKSETDKWISSHSVAVNPNEDVSVHVEDLGTAFDIRVGSSSPRRSPRRSPHRSPRHSPHRSPHRSPTRQQRSPVRHQPSLNVRKATVSSPRSVQRSPPQSPRRSHPDPEATSPRPGPYRSPRGIPTEGLGLDEGTQLPPKHTSASGRRASPHRQGYSSGAPLFHDTSDDDEQEIDRAYADEIDRRLRQNRLSTKQQLERLGYLPRKDGSGRKANKYTSSSTSRVGSFDLRKSEDERLKRIARILNQ